VAKSPRPNQMPRLLTRPMRTEPHPALKARVGVSEWRRGGGGTAIEAAPPPHHHHATPPRARGTERQWLTEQRPKKQGPPRGSTA
jgi:hypothetical protein